MTRKVVSMQGVSFFRKSNGKRDKTKKYIFKDLNLDIIEGDRIALIGANGAGKSTLLRLLAGIFLPDSGTINLETKSKAILDMGFGLDPELTGRENARTMLILDGVERQKRMAYLSRIHEFSDLEDYFDKPIKTYSSGMMIRLIMSVQLMTSEKNGLIIDEGFGTADAAFQAKTFAYVENLIRDSKYMVLASHNEYLIKSYCTRGIVLANSNIAYDGNVEDAFNFYHSNI